MEEYKVIVEPQLGSIKCDFARAKSYLSNRLEEYNGIVFTEESKTQAKATVASLRKEKKAFSDRVMEVKREYMAPFDQFADQAMELIKMFDEPIDFINGQVKDFEKKRIEERKKLISSLYEEIIIGGEDMSNMLPLKKIYNSKWENVSTSQKAIRAEMVNKKIDAKNAVLAIKGMNSDVEEAALNMYKSSFDLTSCISFISKHEEQKRQILEREQARIRWEEEERIRREEREKMLAEQKAREAQEAALRRAEQEKQEALRRAELERQEALRRAEEEKTAALWQAELERQEEARQAEEEKAAAVEQARMEAAQEAIDNLIPDMEEEEGAISCGYEVVVTKSQKEALELYMNSVGIEWSRKGYSKWD